jgi:hypothetical protein
MTTIIIPEVTLVINSTNINTMPMASTGSEAGTITSLYVNGTFQTASGSFIGSYSNNFQLTSANDLSSSIADLSALAETKVRETLGL